MPTVPDKPTLDGLEDKWSARWDAEGIYRFDRSAPREQVFAIDTPPPTVSGSLHMGTVFGYTHTDAVARFQRMAGRAVFYPIGWDDNGLPTERRVQNVYGVTCDPSQPYDPGFEPPAQPPRPPQPISRPNFVELCERLTAEDEQAFEAVFRRLGLSADWSLMYTTANARSRRTSQAAFLHNLARGEAYSQDAPTLWDVDDRTAVAQAEMEDRDTPGAQHRLVFHGDDGDVVIETTRPELVVSCVALVTHPDDERHRHLVGTTVRTPVFGVEVPVVAHPLADPAKGTGIAMICTFGDVTDVTWWRELDLPMRAVVGRDGRVNTAMPRWITDDTGREAYAALAGKTVKQAQAAMVEQLRATGELQGDPTPITHPVKFYERGTRPLEIVTSRQWYIRNGGRDAELRQTFLARGRQLRWHPDHMRHRYDDWVGGLNGDWLISRQRFYGVPIPLWYPVGAGGQPDYGRPLVPDEARLPIDPSTDVPLGYTPDQRNQPGGFVGDPDIMDTWATSSLTPQIVGGWVDEPELWAQVFPMDMRPQGPEIIRTWLFSTIVRSHFEHGELPWSDTTINGWILDPDRKKMSKSKGNVVTPMALFETYGTDAVRYWAACARPGVDTAFDEGQMRIGRKLAIKLLNVSKFVLGFGAPDAGEGAVAADDVAEPVDRALAARLAELVEEATTALAGFDYARALERTEAIFWWFCDDHVELVKARAYGGEGTKPAATASARAGLALALDTLQRMFAPFLPFVTAEVWSWWHQGSVHAQRWPEAAVLREVAGAADPAVLDVASAVLGAARKAKTAAKTSMRTPVAEVVVHDTEARLALLHLVADDVCDAGVIEQLRTVPAATPAIDVHLSTRPTP